MATATSGGMTADAIHRDIEQHLGIVPQWLRQMPLEGLQHYWGLMRDFYLAETTIPNKYKELIGIGISGATRCRYCRLFHTEAAKLFGATDAEITEAAMMGGVTMAGSTFLNAMDIDPDQFAREVREIVQFIQKQQSKAPAKTSPRAHM